MASKTENRKSRIIEEIYPPPGSSQVADEIRARRGNRGLTLLDSVLLHVPPIAEGWNSLLGAVRSKGELPADVREIMILRVGALNGAAFEWKQHEPIAREAGLTTAQLYAVRDTESPLPPSQGILSSLQSAALVFADQSTRRVNVTKEAREALMHELREFAKKSLTREDSGEKRKTLDERKEDLYVEATAVVSSYNMVSRFLVATDVAGMADSDVPWPVERKEHFVSLPATDQGNDCKIQTLHAVTLKSSSAAPWVVFANTLLTDLTLWNPLIPFLLPSSARTKSYNILIYSQRGHGRSTLPPSTQVTMPLLAEDIKLLLEVLSIPTPVHAVVGCSQGGAASLAFARYFPELARGIVASSTAAQTPTGNKEAWAGRIGTVFGGMKEEEVLDKWSALARDGVLEQEVGKGWAYAQTVGMKELAKLTLPRWFGQASGTIGETGAGKERWEWVKEMIEKTSVRGFVAGVGALADYNLLMEEDGKHLFSSPVERVLLVAGTLDGGGKVGDGLAGLQQKWNAVRNNSAHPVGYVKIQNAGHIPMVDATEQFARFLCEFLDEFS